MNFTPIKRCFWIYFIIIAVFCSGIGQSMAIERKTLSIVLREGLEAEGIRRVAEAWGRLRAVDVSVQTLGRPNYEMVTKKSLVEPKPKYDVVFFPGTEVAEMAAKKALAPIERWKPEDDKDLMAYSSFNGKVYGPPCDISTFFTYYRSDVVRSVPETWADLLTDCVQWSVRTNTQSPTTFGLAFAGQAGEDLPKIFYPILWSYGGYILNEGRVGLDSAEAIEAANMLRRLAISQAVPLEIQTWDVIRILDELQAGNVAISTPQWNALYPLIKDAKDDPIAKAINIAKLPGVRQADGSIRRVNFKHTWVLVKPANGSKSELANDFILYATGRDGAMIYAQTSRGNPARRSILSDEKLQQERPEFRLMLECLQSAQAEPDVPFYSEMHETMNRSLSSIISGRQSPRDAMRRAAERVRELVKSYKNK